jgi:phosphinothricin acetyltransferase
MNALRGSRRAKPGSAGDPLRTGRLIRGMRADDWPAVATIYAEGIATRLATFETTTPTWEEWDASHLAAHRLVSEEDGDVAGWAALSAYSDRECYRGVAEVSVYVAERARGRGIGRALLGALVESTERDGVWTLQAGVFPENVASLALHRRSAFRVVGIRERLGKLDGSWRDVVLLERRSELS